MTTTLGHHVEVQGPRGSQGIGFSLGYEKKTTDQDEGTTQYTWRTVKSTA
jgi:hypothetical protein